MVFIIHIMIYRYHLKTDVDLSILKQTTRHTKNKMHRKYFLEYNLNNTTNVTQQQGNVLASG